MSIEITNLGDNSRKIEINDETSSLGIIDAVNTSLVDLGQTLIDTMSSGALNCLVTKVYSAPNDDFDGIMNTTKYMIIRYDGPRQKQNVSCCEFQDTTSHSATNECSTNGRAIILPLQYSNCNLYIFASQRYAAFIGTVFNEPSAWQGIFEFERILPEDTASNGIPCFGQTSSLTIGEPLSSNYGNLTITTFGSFPVVFCVPRTFSGLTKEAAAKSFTINTNLGDFPPNTYNLIANTGGITYTINKHHGHLGGYGGIYSLDNNKVMASSLKLNTFNSNTLYSTGKIHGLSVIKLDYADLFDTIDIPMDSDKFVDSTGSPTKNIIMGIQGGYIDSISKYNINNIELGANYTITKILCVGKFLYFGTTVGILKWDINLASGQLFTTSSVADLLFDGNNHIYFTTTATTVQCLGKINVLTDEITYSSGASPSTGSGLAIAIDDNYIYMSRYHVANTTKNIDIYTISSFSYTRRNTNTINTGSSNVQINGIDACGYNGYVGAITVNIPSTTANQIILWKVIGETGAMTLATLNSSNTGHIAGGLYYTEDDTLFICLINTSSANSIAQRYDMSTESPTFVNYNTGGVISGSNGRGNTSINNTIPYMGFYSFPATGSKLAFHSPYFNMSTDQVGRLFEKSAVDVSNILLIRLVATDGCNLYTGYSGGTYIEKVTESYGKTNSKKDLSSKILIPV